MRTEAQRSYRHGFVLTEEELRRLVTLAAEQVRKATGGDPTLHMFVLRFRNGAIADTRSIDEVLQQENMGTSALSRLAIIVGSGEKDKDWTVELTFIDVDREEDTGWTAVRYKIVGNERDWVFVTSSMIEERIRRIRRFALNQLLTLRGTFGRLAVPLVTLTAVLGVTLLSVGRGARVRQGVVDSLAATITSGHPANPLDAILALERARIASESEPASLGLYNPIVVLLAVLAGVVGILALWSYLFPVYNFVWGDYEHFFKRRQAIGRGILVVVVLGVIIGVVANILSKGLGF